MSDREQPAPSHRRPDMQYSTFIHENKFTYRQMNVGHKAHQVLHKEH
jgi:hypothetical protein